MTRRIDGPLAVFLVAGAAALALPLGAVGGWTAAPAGLALWLAALALGIFLWRPARAGQLHLSAVLALAAVLAGATALIHLVALGAGGKAATGLWLAVIALGFVAWRAMERVATFGQQTQSRLADVVVPGLFGLWVLYLWQIVVVGFAVPPVLLPPPSAIAEAIAATQQMLWQDFVQTFVKSVIPGYVMGCGAGFLVALLVDRVPFLQRGLLPVGNLVSALPIVGVAPIMVMWFGFDWQSKAAVVVIMTFFPMLVNTISGLNATGRIERDLMRTYAASYAQTLLTVRLPAAMPFVFNALKINSTLALIGAIVAEFFGTPILGMGFRISTEVGRMNIAMVWATIAVAAAAGSASYGAMALMERRFTFWHPSFRQ
ncbi:MAG: ABC transporter permease [Rhodospirillales bacterium]|nr:ABC transporter permease [Rhodospirillales bacterium]